MSVPARLAPRIVFTWALGASALSGCAVQPTRPEAPAATRDGRWRQDLAYLARNLPRLHVDAFHATTREAFEERVAALERRVPELCDEALAVELTSLVACIGDSHTRLDTGAALARDAIPLLVDAHHDGWFVIAAAREHTDLIGCRVTSVEGRPLEQVIRALAAVVPAENRATLELGALSAGFDPPLLFHLGLSDARGRVGYGFERDGHRLERTLDAVPLGSVALVGSHSFLGSPVPLTLTRRDEVAWWTRLPQAPDVLYLAYNRCHDDPGAPFRDLVRALLAEDDARPARALVIDLRWNTGGNSEVVRPLLDALARHPRLNQPGRLFVLIGARTYSAGLSAAARLARSTRATLVGEPTGQRGWFYADTRTFRLPNSGFVVAYASRFFRVLEQDLPGLPADLPAPTTGADYLAGRDPVLAAALAATAPGDAP